MKNILKQNLNRIEEKVAEFLPEDSEKPTIIAVSKYVDTATVRALYDIGVRHFGENRVDGLLEKQAELEDIHADINWHFIGNVQKRPVKKFINTIDYLHSLDRLSIADEIQKRAEHPINSFLQVNVSGEDTKSGFSPEEVFEAVESLKNYDNLNIIGLMTMAPHDASDAELHGYFKTLRELQESVQELGVENAPCTELSMGMSDDYGIAVSEGATYVRIGSAFFEDIN